MKLWQYLAGRRVVLRSPLPKDEVAGLILNAVGNPFWPTANGITGLVVFGHVRLAWSVPFFSNGFRPVFSGSLKNDLGRTEFRASYGAPALLLVFFVFWYAILALIGLTGLAAWLGARPETGNEWLVPVVVPVFMVAPLAFHFVFNRNADQHWDAILELLRREAQLTPDP